jgi:hypothetical protein
MFLLNFLFLLIRLALTGAVAIVLLIGVVLCLVFGFIPSPVKAKRVVPVKNILRERDKIKATIETAQGEPAMLKCGDLIRRFQDDYYEDPDCYEFTKQLWDLYNGQACVVESRRLVKV